MNYKVLMVEEEPVLAAELSAHLEKEGYQVKRVSSPDEVAAAVISFAPHLHLLDASSPAGDNFLVLRSLRSYAALRETSEAPLLAITGGAHDHERLSKLGLAADAFIAKPFDRAKLMRMIRKVLDS